MNISHYNDRRAGMVAVLGVLVFCFSLPSRGDSIVYSSGPVNGQLNAFAINDGSATSDSFTASNAATADGVSFVTWHESSSDVIFNNSEGLSMPDPGSALLTLMGIAAALFAKRFLKNCSRFVAIFAVAICARLHADPIVSVYSSGYVLPETISAAPASFGLPAGTLIVADAGNLALSNPNATIYAVPPGRRRPGAHRRKFQQ
jgi:hypothetical protein